MSTLTDVARITVERVHENMQTAQVEDNFHEFVDHSEAAVTALSDVIRQLTAHMDATKLARLHRPNGKPYRARQMPRPTIPTSGPDAGKVVVLRTHDIHQARRVAQTEHRRLITDETPHRLAWWNKHPNGRDVTVYFPDEEHGFPVVIFEVKP